MRSVVVNTLLLRRFSRIGRQLGSRRSIVAFLLGLFAISDLATVALGDFVIYRIPGSKAFLTLEGKSKVVSGNIIEYTHPSFGSVVFSRENSVSIKAPTRQEEFKRLWGKANKSKTVNDYLEAARQAIQRGLLKEFYDCCSAAYKLDPKNETLARLIEARKLVKQPLGDSSAVEAHLKDVTGRSTMKLAKSAHYVMLHDTSDSKIGRKRQTRAETRLELLESVYELYFMKFALEGIVLQPPQEHMMILLFGDEKDFLRYSTLLNPALKNAAGFWSPRDNVGVFFDQGTTPSMKKLATLSEELQQLKVRARGTVASKEMAHLANAIELMSKILREESDVEVVSHEATHQLAGNTGLMPRGKISLRWAHEGLASYFESSSGAGWSGIGAVNDERLADYKIVSSDPARRDIRYVITDMLFDEAGSGKQAVEAYGQAWALTHFLMETRFDKLIAYYRKTSELDVGEKGIARRELIRMFEDSFGNLDSLQREWHQYMSTLKSDIDRMRDSLK